MDASDRQPNDPWTYFGVYSAAQIARVSALLKSLGAEFRVDVQEQSDERLKAWAAWDSSAANPREGHELWIHTPDLGKVGTKIVDMYPERKFGAV